MAITDLRQEALDLARELGARVTQRTLHDETPEEAARKLKESAAPDGFDIVIDCAGFESTMQVRLAASGGSSPGRHGMVCMSRSLIRGGANKGHTRQERAAHALGGLPAMGMELDTQACTPRLKHRPRWRPPPQGPRWSWWAWARLR